MHHVSLLGVSSHVVVRSHGNVPGTVLIKLFKAPDGETPTGQFLLKHVLLELITVSTRLHIGQSDRVVCHVPVIGISDGHGAVALAERVYVAVRDPLPPIQVP